MVRATTSLDTVRHDLETVEGGWVELRPMTYGQFLKRQDMAMKMGVSGDAFKGKLEKLDIDMIQEAVTRYEFQVCVADHNLEDENGRKLSLSSAGDFERLDPRIGQEIEQLIADMTQWDSPKSKGELSEGSGEDTNLSQDSSTE